MNTFNFSDYRDLIQSSLENKGRGSKLKLAEFLNCNPGYISQVLSKGKIHFSPENIIKVSEFLKLNAREEEFLLTLLQFERAGSKELQHFYKKKIQKFQDESLKIDKQIKDVNTELDDATKAIYYSHWAYSAIHMMVSIDRYQKIDTIAERLKLSLAFTQRVLSFLEDKHLVIKSKHERYSIGKTRMHLKADSPLVKSHHQNYRHKAILSLEDENDFNLHYSGVLTLSKKDALKIRALVLKMIADTEEILIPSANEEIMSLNLDIFKL